MRVAICDDEKEQRDFLLECCKRYNASLSIDTYTSALDLLVSFERTSYDIVFMDIELPSLNGFEAAKALRQRVTPPLVIFITKSNSYTILGYGIAFRYLPKPVTYDTVSAVLSLAIKECEPEKISIICDGKYQILNVKDIIYCEILDHNLTIYTRSARYCLRTTMSDLLSQLPSEDFTQPHKSYLVNLSYVQTIGFNSVSLISGETQYQVPLSKGKRKEFVRKLGEYIGR